MILNRIFLILVRSLVLTAVIEGAAAYLLGVRSGIGQLIVLLANIVTNPPMNFALTAASFLISPELYYWLIAPLEIAVVIAEAAIYKSVLRPKINPFLLSLILNACSYFLGTGILFLIRR